MRVLVTGGNGFIGSEVASHLAERGYNVVIYDIGAWDRQVNNIEYIKGDVFDAVRLKEVLSSCDVIIHMVELADARVAQEHPQLSFDLNLRSLQVAFEAAELKNLTTGKVLKAELMPEVAMKILSAGGVVALLKEEYGKRNDDCEQGRENLILS